MKYEWVPTSNPEPLRVGDVFTNPCPRPHDRWTSETMLTVTGISGCKTFVWVRPAKQDGSPDWRTAREIFEVGRAFVRLEKVVRT